MRQLQQEDIETIEQQLSSEDKIEITLVENKDNPIVGSRTFLVKKNGEALYEISQAVTFAPTPVIISNIPRANIALEASGEVEISHMIMIMKLDMAGYTLACPKCGSNIMHKRVDDGVTFTEFHPNGTIANEACQSDGYDIVVCTGCAETIPQAMSDIILDHMV